MSTIRSAASTLVSRGTAITVAVLTAAAVVSVAPPAFAAAPNIVSMSSSEVGLGAGQSGHAPETITINVDNVATTDTVTVTFPGFTGLSASVVTPLTTGGGHTIVTARVSTSSSSAVSSGFNLTLTDVTAGNLTDTAPFAILAAPKLSSANPAHLVRGTTTPTVSLTGTGLQSGVLAAASGVTFGTITVGGGGTSGSASPVTVDPGASSGPLTVTLTNPDAGWSSQTGAITIDTFPLADVSPAAASNATGNTSVVLTVTGTGIPTGASVRLTPTPAITGQDPIVGPSGSVSADRTTWQGVVNLVGAAPGSYQLQLISGAEMGTLMSKAFTVTAAGNPIVSTVSPSQLGQGADTTLTITGANFARGATVTFNKSTVTTTGPVVFDSTTQVRVPIHVASNAATGSNNAVSVTVTNPGNGAGTYANALVITSGPVITSLSPSILGQGAATTLTINGSSFSTSGQRAVVIFGTGITATGSASVSSNQIRIPVKVDAKAPSTVSVRVQNPDLGAAVDALPINTFAVTAVSPRYVPSNYFGYLTITGTDFRNGAVVSFPVGSGVAVQSGRSASVTNSSTLSVPITVSRTTAAAVDVTVTNIGSDYGSGTAVGGLGVAVAPGAPTPATATKSGTTATVSWTAVVSPRDGGAPITSYTVAVTSPANSGIPAVTVGPSVTTAYFSGLAPDIDYAFAVTATNAANLTSAAATATTSRHSIVTLRAGATRVVTGQTLHLFGRLTAAGGSPIAGAGLTVNRRSDAGGLGTAGTVTTDANGNWSMIIRPRHNMTYSASYAGDAVHEADTSPGVRVVAAVRIEAHGFVSGANDTFTVYGRVFPNKAGETVRLVALDTAGRLHHLGRMFLDNRSRFRFHVPLPSAQWLIQVRMSATGGNGAGRSAYLMAHA